MPAIHGRYTFVALTSTGFTVEVTTGGLGLGLIYGPVRSIGVASTNFGGEDNLVVPDTWTTWSRLKIVNTASTGSAGVWQILSGLGGWVA